MIKNIINQGQGSHWYYPDGRECFEVPSADGKKMVKTTIVHARKLGLYPSVTTVLKILDKPEIDTWRVERAIKASLASVRRPGERIKQFIARILEVAQSKSKRAMNFGGDLHSYIEGLITGNTFDSILIPQATKDAIKDYFTKNIQSATAEQLAINHELKYAGRKDMDALIGGGTYLYDFKTQGTKPGKPVNFYKEFIIQLGGYSLCGSYTGIRCMIISSTEPGRVEVKDYTAEEIAFGQKTFKHLNALFRLIKEL